MTVKRLPTAFENDKFVRAVASAEDLAKLKPVFVKEGTVTAGNASGVNDGAAAVVLAGEAAVKQHGLKPLARLIAYGHAGVDPAYMGIGPVPRSEARRVGKGGVSTCRSRWSPVL